MFKWAKGEPNDYDKQENKLQMAAKLNYLWNDEQDSPSHPPVVNKYLCECRHQICTFQCHIRYQQVI